MNFSLVAFKRLNRKADALLIHDKYNEKHPDKLNNVLLKGNNRRGHENVVLGFLIKNPRQYSKNN